MGASKLIAIELTINIEIKGSTTFPFSGGTTTRQQPL
jgi:hypothetical protein